MNLSNHEYEQFEQPRVTAEIADLNRGPIELSLAGTDIAIVNPIRDLSPEQLQDINPEIGCFIIQPDVFDVKERIGYKALRKGESVVLGRDDNLKGRFQFNDTVSRQHVRITRAEEGIFIEDMDSSNGTFMGSAAVRAAMNIQYPEFHGQKQETGFEQKSYSIASSSVASDHHPHYNDDSFFVDNDKPALAVFDGLGGNPGSSFAAEIAAKSTYESLHKEPSQQAVAKSLNAVRSALSGAHTDILTQAPDADIATTATVAKLYKDEQGSPYAAIASVGDSRAYILRHGHLSAVTIDQSVTLAETPEDKREMQRKLSEATSLEGMTKEERLSHKNRHFVTSCLGDSKKPPKIDTYYVMLQSGDRLLMTTDGVHDNLTTSEITKVLRESNDDENAVNSLTTVARKRAASNHFRSKLDDITATILSYYE